MTESALGLDMSVVLVTGIVLHPKTTAIKRLAVMKSRDYVLGWQC